MSEGNLKIEKIQKSSKAALLVTNILKILCIVCAAVAILAGCIIIGARTRVNNGLGQAMEMGAFSAEELLDLGDGKTIVLQSLIEDGCFAEVLGVYAITTGIAIICMAIVLHFVGKVFKNFMESYTPFAPAILKNLKIVFILLTLFTLRSSVGIGIIVGLASWCVINIFEYGCELQKQSDETL